MGDDYVSELHILDRNIHEYNGHLFHKEIEQRASQGNINEAFDSVPDDLQTTNSGNKETICDPHQPQTMWNSAASLRGQFKQA